VPKVFCAFEHGGWTYILIERIREEKIGSGWVMHRSENSKAKNPVTTERDDPREGMYLEPNLDPEVFKNSLFNTKVGIGRWYLSMAISAV
jgi:hypothetical protein